MAQTIIKGYRKAAELALQKLKDISIDLSTKDPAEKTNMLRKCGMIFCMDFSFFVSLQISIWCKGFVTLALHVAFWRSFCSLLTESPSCFAKYITAETTLNSKLVADYKEFFSEMVVRAIQILGEDLDYRGIGIKKV